MARDDIGARSLWLGYMTVLDGARPSGVLGWVSPVAPVVTQAAVGAGHWAAGGGGSGPWRRGRALLATGWAALGLGTEAPTQAERRARTSSGCNRTCRAKGPGTKSPVTAGTQSPAVRHLSRRAPQYGLAATVVGTVLSVRWDLRHPFRLTVLAIASQTSAVVFSFLRVARAVERRRPNSGAGRCCSPPNR